MIFVNNTDVFLFYEDNVPRQVYLTSETLNKQLEDLIKSDIIIQNDIKYLLNIFNTLYENKPLDNLNKLKAKYFEKTDLENSDEYIKMFTDFGTIKHWKNDENY